MPIHILDAVIVFLLMRSGRLGMMAKYLKPELLSIPLREVGVVAAAVIIIIVVVAVVAVGNVVYNEEDGACS